jgi:hypothetical protein
MNRKQKLFKKFDNSRLQVVRTYYLGFLIITGLIRVQCHRPRGHASGENFQKR